MGLGSLENINNKLPESSFTQNQGDLLGYNDLRDCGGRVSVTNTMMAENPISIPAKPVRPTDIGSAYGSQIVHTLIVDREPDLLSGMSLKGGVALKQHQGIMITSPKKSGKENLFDGKTHSNVDPLLSVSSLAKEKPIKKKRKGVEVTKDDIGVSDKALNENKPKKLKSKASKETIFFNDNFIKQLARR
nr:zinc-finger domain of monoamine-oxidase A repressor R1 [Tanacetum cinerariifolium]